MSSQVILESLTKQYGALRAVDSLSFSLKPGEWVALMGPSGSGKTTLVNILGGLDTLTSGRVIVDGTDLSKLSESQLVRYRAEKIGFVFQQFHLVPYLTALENVMLAQYFHSATDESQAAEALKRVGLGDRLTHLPAQLSGGEQQRVAIARALINQPKLILADEPTGNLDEANENIVLQLFKELHDAGHTILMVTHDPDIARQADRRIELAHGHLHFDTAQHGPGHPLACPLADTADCCNPTTEDEIRFDHLLEQIWICGEEGKPAQVNHLYAQGHAARSPPAAAARAVHPPDYAHVRPAFGRTARWRSPPDRLWQPPRARRREASSTGRAPFQGHFLDRRLRSPQSGLQIRAHHQPGARSADLHVPWPSRKRARTAMPFRPAPAATAIASPEPLAAPMPTPLDPRKNPSAVKIHVTSGAGVDITWADGHSSHYDFPFLRDECPCATCNDERQKKSRVRVGWPGLFRRPADVQAQAHR